MFPESVLLPWRDCKSLEIRDHMLVPPLDYLDQWFFRCGLWTSSTSITWELLRNAKFWYSHQTYKVRNSGWGSVVWVLTSPPNSSDTFMSLRITGLEQFAFSWVYVRCSVYAQWIEMQSQNTELSVWPIYTHFFLVIPHLSKDGRQRLHADYVGTLTDPVTVMMISPLFMSGK